MERWDDFRRDVRWFRGIHTDAAWAKIHVDHGFNGTPVWLIAGWTLANASPTTGRSVIVLSLVDWLLLAIMWGFVWRAFGWRTMCVALVFWGTNYPGHFGWTGGSFLRQDWLAALLIGLCLLRMERPMAAGFMITTAALLRIYPGFVFIAIALQAAVAILSEKRLYLAPAHVRGAIGALLVIVVVVPSSRLITGDLSLWSDFFANLELHAGTRGANRTSLETWVSHDATRSMSRLEALDLDAFYVSDAWIQARKAKFEERRLMYWGSVIALLALLATAVRREALWVVGALGLGLIPIIADPSNYYLGAFIGVALLAQRNATLGAAACAMAALTVLTSRVLFWPDELFVGVSIEVVLLVIFVWAYAATKSPSLELAGGSPPTARGEVST